MQSASFLCYCTYHVNRSRSHNTHSLEHYISIVGGGLARNGTFSKAGARVCLSACSSCSTWTCHCPLLRHCITPDIRSLQSPCNSTLKTRGGVALVRDSGMLYRGDPTSQLLWSVSPFSGFAEGLIQTSPFLFTSGHPADP